MSREPFLYRETFQVEAVKTFSLSVSSEVIRPSSLDELPFESFPCLVGSSPPFLFRRGAFFPLQLHF